MIWIPACKAISSYIHERRTARRNSWLPLSVLLVSLLTLQSQYCCTKASMISRAFAGGFWGGLLVDDPGAWRWMHSSKTAFSAHNQAYQKRNTTPSKPAASCNTGRPSPLPSMPFAAPHASCSTVYCDQRPSCCIPQHRTPLPGHLAANLANQQVVFVDTSNVLFLTWSPMVLLLVPHEPLAPLWVAHLC